MKTDKTKKMIYVPPTVEITKVVLEKSLANTVAASVQVDMGSNWIIEDTPVGNSPVTDGGDIYLFPH